jgi:catechol 2,3-dioxygenase-like lactoylglutathione lyase family enzyme
MLEKYPVHAAIPCKDFDRAKVWYRDKLGLTPSSEDAGGAYYECGGGTSFGLFPTPYAGTAKNTQMEWSVPDIKAAVEELKASGVVFDIPDMGDSVTWDGEVATMGPLKAAWFKDSEDNTIGLTEQIPS